MKIVTILKYGKYIYNLNLKLNLNLNIFTNLKIKKKRYTLITSKK